MCPRFQFCTHQRDCIIHYLKKSQIRCTLVYFLSHIHIPLTLQHSPPFLYRSADKFDKILRVDLYSRWLGQWLTCGEDSCCNLTPANNLRSRGKVQGSCMLLQTEITLIFESESVLFDRPKADDQHKSNSDVL